MSEEGFTPGLEPSLPLEEQPAELLQDESRTAHRFGDFVLVQQIGWGGHGVVYRAWQKSVRRWVALKFLHVGDAVAMERFAREARVAAKLDHPNIVPVFEVGTFEGRAFITMQLIDGEPLDHRRMEVAKAIEVIAAAADAVHHAHEQGIIHRDLKPANMMLSRDGHLYVMDFGLVQGVEGESRLTKTGAVNGTPSYMSPEQAKGQVCDARSDVYSLGASLYELLCRRAPFEGANAVVVLARVLSEEPLAIRHLNPNVTREMDAIVAKAMEKSPARRYQTAAELAVDLRRVMRGEPALAKPLASLSRAARWINRHRLVTAFIASLSVGAICAVAASLFHAASMSRAQAHAEEARRIAEEELAQSLIAQGDSLAASGRITAAAARFKDAQRVLSALGQSPFAANLGLMVVRQSGAVPLTTFEGHAGVVTSVKFLPDSKRAVSASEDGTVRLWELTTGKTLRVLEGHAAQVWALAVSPDGKRLATGGFDGTVKVWDIDAGLLLLTFREHNARVSSVVWSVDGHQVFSGAADNMIRQWDADTGTQRRVFEGHTDRVRGLAVSHDGMTLASASIDNTVRIWDLRTARATIIKNVAAMFAVRFVNEGKAVLAAGHEGDLGVWTLSGQLLAWTDANRGLISDVAISPGNDLVVSAGWDAHTRIFAQPPGVSLGEIESDGARVLSVDISADGRLMIDGDSAGHLRLFDLRAAAKTQVTRRDFEPSTVEFSRDGRVAASWKESPFEVLVWDVETKKLLKRLATGHQVKRVAFAPGSLSLAVVTGNDEAMVWQLASDRVTRWATLASPTSVAFSQDENTVWVAAPSGIAVHDLSTGVSTNLPTDVATLRLATSRDGLYLASAARDGRVGIWNTATKQLVRWYPIGSTVTSVAFSPDGGRVFAGSAMHGTHVIDLRQQAIVASTTGVVSQVFGLGVSPEGQLFVTGGTDRTPRLWNATTATEVRALPSVVRTISNAVFADDGRILVGQTDGTFTVWDPHVAPAFDSLLDRVTASRAAIKKGTGTAEDWHALGDWFASRGVCIEAVEAYSRGRSMGSTEPSAGYARCLWSLGRASNARQELSLAVVAGVLPAGYANLLMGGLPLTVGASEQADELAKAQKSAE